ncbi:MAG: hypothetical protein E5W30_10480, partial [Mesorhizobium sp.]
MLGRVCGPWGTSPYRGKNSMNGVVVDAELPGNGASAPLLDMVIAQDLGLQFRRYGHRCPQDGDVRNGLAATQRL